MTFDCCSSLLVHGGAGRVVLRHGVGQVTRGGHAGGGSGVRGERLRGVAERGEEVDDGAALLL